MDVPLDAETDGPIFTARPWSLEHLGAVDNARPQRVAAVAAASLTLLACFQSGDTVRWDGSEGLALPIDFGRERCADVGRVLLEPKGFHALVTSSTGDCWYLNIHNSQAKSLPKLKGHQIEVVAWDPESTSASTKDLIIGTEKGQLLHVVIEGKEKVVKPLFTLELGGASNEQRRVPICGVHRERVNHAVDGTERMVIFVAAGCGIYAFMGPSLETLFTKYQGEAGAARALVYEVPRDSPRGELHVDAACVGPNYSRALFWLTGVGVLVALIKDNVQADNAVLECPPGIIPFPASPKAVPNRAGGSLVSSLLPPPPPPAPLSMALTKYHVILLFDDRWAAMSRITHELVQQQEFARTTHGFPRGLARDVYGENVWMYSDHQIFEIIAEREERHVWRLLLKLDRFDDALAAKCKPMQRTRVLAAHADWLFRNGKLLESARKFAEATTVPFEHVALRFLQVDQKGALLEYLRCRLRQCSPGDKVTRALLSVWAVEISLAHLNELQLSTQAPKGRATLDEERLKEERKNLHELFKDCKDLDVHEPVYHLLQSHGWLEELAKFAETRRDFNTVIVHHVSRRDCLSAIKKLADFVAAGAGEDLLCRFAPVLFGAEPRAFISLLLQPQLEKVDPLSLLPAIYLPRAPATHRAEAIRYLRHVVQNHPELMGHGTNVSAEGELATAPSIRTRSLMLGSDFVGGANEEAIGGGTAALACGSWASGTAVLNALIVLYACECVSSREGRQHDATVPRAVSAVPSMSGGPEDELIAFLKEQEENPFLDPRFALRICSERALPRAVVLLYGIMGMHEEAVDVALQQGDLVLAKENARKPGDQRLRHKLWLRIVENQVTSGDVQKITSLIRESQELTIRDILPYVADSMTIDAFQADICECLDTYENQIQTLRQEMDDHRNALETFKEDLKQAEERCVVVNQDQVCEICAAFAMQERFYVFACRHCFHEACLRALILPVLSDERRERLLALEATRIEHQAAAGGALSGPPAIALAEIEDELDGILADDCPLCGWLMIQTITRPFIDPHEQAEVDSWAIT